MGLSSREEYKIMLAREVMHVVHDDADTLDKYNTVRAKPIGPLFPLFTCFSATKYHASDDMTAHDIDIFLSLLLVTFYRPSIPIRR